MPSYNIYDDWKWDKYKDDFFNKTTATKLEELKLAKMFAQDIQDSYKQTVIDRGYLDHLLKQQPVETEDQKVIRILKGDFEKKFGMTFERFVEVRERLIETHPEKLI